MTDMELRDLLHDRVDDLTTADLVDDAWAGAVRRRRTRRAVAAGGVVLAVVVAGVALDRAQLSTRGDLEPMPGTSEPSPSAPSVAPRTTPDAIVGGAEVWFSPDSAGEAALPRVDGDPVLPEVLDLDASAPLVEDAPISRAVVALAVAGEIDDSSRVDRVLLWGPDGYRTLMLPERAEPTDWMLAEDGRSLHLGTSTYVFADRQWYGERVADTRGRQDRVPWQVSSSDPYGPTRVDPTGWRSARAYGMGPGLPNPAGGTTGPESIAVVPLHGAGATFLAISAPSPGLDGRWLQCCPVVGWLDADTLVYEARGSEPKVLAWTVGTGDFRLVSRIVGLAEHAAYTASFAALPAD
jgi:hypothetical protein